MKRTKNGSYKIGRYEIFFIPSFSWLKWGSYNIGKTRVLQRGLIRIFVSPFCL